MGRNLPRVPHCAYAIALLVLLGGIAAILATPPGDAQEEDIVDVTLVDFRDDNETEDFAFEPNVTTVDPGTTVRWTLDHDVFHTVTSTDTQERRRPNDLFHQTLSSEGDTFEFTFEQSGEFHYYCQPHANFMFGTVIVQGNQTDPGGPEEEDTPGLGAVVVGLLIVALAVTVARRR